MAISDASRDADRPLELRRARAMTRVHELVADLHINGKVAAAHLWLEIIDSVEDLRKRRPATRS